MMFTKWVGSVVSGRIRHWNDTNNQLVSDLYSEIEQFEEPYRTTFQGALVSSLQIMERMLGPDAGRKGWIGLDLLDVSRRELEGVYAVLIDVFLATNANLFPELKSGFSDGKKHLFGMSEIVPNVTALLEQDRENIEAVAQATWDSVAEILNPSKASDITSRFRFVAFFLVSATENAKQLRLINHA